MKIEPLPQAELLKGIRKPTLPPSRPHKSKKENRFDCRQEIDALVNAVTAKLRHVDY